MQIDNRMLDDLARVANGALGTLAGVKGEIETILRQQLEKLLGSMELVTREEFDAVKAMAVKAREEQEEISARLEAIEARLGTAAGEAKAGTAKTSAAKAAASKTSAAKAGTAKTGTVKTGGAKTDAAKTGKAATKRRGPPPSTS